MAFKDTVFILLAILLVGTLDSLANGRGDNNNGTRTVEDVTSENATEENANKGGETLTGEMSKVGSLVSTMEKTVADNVKHVKDLTNMVNELAQMNHKQSKQLKHVMMEMEKQNAAHEAKESKLQKNVAHLEKLVSASSKKASLVSAFSAHPKTAYSKDFKGRMVFDNVQYKLGPGYNAATGKFKAPTRGLYAFHLTVGSVGEDVARVGIFVKSREVSRVWLASDDLDGQSSTSTVVELKPGDVVQVRKNSGEARLESGLYSTFSGYLVKAL